MTNKLYFPGLNAIRAFAALSVVMHHIETAPVFFRSELVPPGLTIQGLFFMSGEDAVTLFFVLSGFLITYLLLREIETAGTVSVRQFYVRRVLRIWPLYYLVVFLSFLGLPLLVPGYPLPSTNPAHVLLVLFIMPNLDRIVPFGTIPHLWSIGVEEQFYALWPNLMKVMRRNVPLLLFAVIAVKLLLDGALALLASSNAAFELPSYVISHMRFENMAIGGLGAYLVFSKHPLLRVLFHPLVEKAALVFIAINVVIPFGVLDSFSVTWHLFSAAIYMIFIVNSAANPKAFKVENKWAKRLGEVSYGIYMYHCAVIHIFLIVLGSSSWLTPGYYLAVVGVTIAASIVSYDWFEKPFLRLKGRVAAQPELKVAPDFQAPRA